MSKEPYVVRKLTAALLVPLLVGVAWFAFLELVGFDIPTLELNTSASKSPTNSDDAHCVSTSSVQTVISPTR